MTPRKHPLKDRSTGPSGRERLFRTPFSAHPELAEPWSGEKLYFNGENYFGDILKALRQARRSVDFEVYIFEAGVLGDRLVEAFQQASRRGVKVRVLVDGVGSPDFASHYGPLLTGHGVQFRVYRSWPWFFTSVFGAFRFKGFTNSLQKVRALWAWGKRRNHRKLCVVDGKKIWIGSFNVSDWHLRKIKGKGAWRDTGMGLAGVKILVFRLAFQLAWEDGLRPGIINFYRRFLVRWLSRDVLESPVWVTATRRLRRGFRRELLERFRSAGRRIWITTPYFVPTRVLLRALANSARQGRDVRVILPGLPDVPAVRWASMAFYRELMKAGCRIFEYQSRVLHAKSLLADSWGLVGSGNLDHRSLRQDLEVNVVPRDPKSLKALERQFLLDQRQSKEIILADLLGRPLWDRALSWLFFHFRYWF